MTVENRTLYSDHPKLRESERCPVCRGNKDTGLLCCWHCYREKRIKYGNPEVQKILDQEERQLGGAL